MAQSWPWGSQIAVKKRKKKLTLFVATDQMPGHNEVETSIMSIDSSSTNVIIRVLEEVY